MNTTENPQAGREPEEHPRPAGADGAVEERETSPAAESRGGSPFVEGSATTGGTAAEPVEGAGTEPAAGAEAESAGADAESAERAPEARTALYVRRRRVPALGFWVLLSFLVPGVVALLSVPLFGFGDLRGVVNFVLLAMVVIGLPLAALASFIDARRHRGEERRRR